jgi:hypothetical protein
LRKAEAESKVLAVKNYAEAQSRAVQQTSAAILETCCTVVAPQDIELFKA